MTDVDRIQIVLAEVCNLNKVNGLSTWQPEDFYSAAKKFVGSLRGAVLLHPHPTRLNIYLEIHDFLGWDIPANYRALCIGACLDELYDEYVGDGLC